MTTTARLVSNWTGLCDIVISSSNRIYIGWFGVLMIPTLLTATAVFFIAFAAAPPVDIDGIREVVCGSLLYGNIITGAVVPTSNAIGLHFYPIWEAATVDEWLYNGGPYQCIVCHFFIGICSYMGREWELSFRLGMRPWIAVAYSAPVAAAVSTPSNILGHSIVSYWGIEAQVSFTRWCQLGGLWTFVAFHGALGLIGFMY